MGKLTVQVARQLMVAVRGSRSQVQFSRWLGYRSNVAADWEGGHRFPTGAEALRACSRAGIDVHAALSTFHPDSAQAWSAGDEGLATWLRAIQGSTPNADLARRCGITRHRAGRWLRGQTRPRLPDLLGLIDGCTGRLADWVAALVPIERVPALHGRWRASHLARDLAWQQPWAVAIYALLESGVHRETAPVVLSERFGLSVQDVREHRRTLESAGLIHADSGGLWSLPEAPSMRVPAGTPRQRLRMHWSEVARSRVAHEADLYSWNLFGVSRADLARIRALHRAYYREVRSIVAASAPIETVGLILMHTCELADGGPQGADDGGSS